MPLKIEIIAIGDEILTGFTINTNSALVGQALLNIGLRVTSQRTVGDDKDSIQNGLRDSIAKNDLLICSGGLGPTCDDVTRQIITDLFQCELRLEKDVINHLEKRYKNKSLAIENQALVPSKAKYILNELGTASALIFDEQNTLVIFLPGVPAEFGHFVHTEIIPFLLKKYPDERSEFRQQCYFMHLGESHINPTLVQLMEKYPAIKFGIYPNLGLLSVHIISELQTIEENLQLQEPVKNELIAAFPDNFYSDAEQSLEKIICKLCNQNQITINLIEDSPYLNLRSQFGAVLDNVTGNLTVEVRGVPKLFVDEEIYQADIEIEISLSGNDSIKAQYNFRGNKKMFVTRCEHAVQCELFKFLTKS